MNDDAKAVVAIASRLGDSTRPSLSPTKWDRFASVLRDGGHELSEVMAPGFDPGDVLGLDPDTVGTVRELLASAPAATVAAADLERHGIRVLTLADDEYPEVFRSKLGALAPPVIYAVGNLDLLTGDGIGVVGSRDISPEGKDVAEQIARLAAEHGRSVVSGGARGVDSFAMNAAFMAGGTVIGVLADALQRKVQGSDMLSAIESGTVCLLSQQIPSAGFTPAAAMGRNKLVYALTETTVVVASDNDSGGTWAGAVEAIKKQYAKVAVWVGEGAGPGDEDLVAQGGIAVSSIETILELESAGDQQAEQLTFG